MGSMQRVSLRSLEQSTSPSRGSPPVNCAAKQFDTPVEITSRLLSVARVRTRGESPPLAPGRHCSWPRAWQDASSTQGAGAALNSRPVQMSAKSWTLCIQCFERRKSYMHCSLPDPASASIIAKSAERSDEVTKKGSFPPRASQATLAWSAVNGPRDDTQVPRDVHGMGG